MKRCIREEFLEVIRRSLHGPLTARQLTRSSALCPRCTRARVNSRRNARIAVETRRAIATSFDFQPLWRKVQFYIAILLLVH